MFAWRSGSQRSLGQLFESWFGTAAQDTKPSDTKSQPTTKEPTAPPLTSRVTAARKPG